MTRGSKRKICFGFESEAPVPISLAVRAGDFVFVSGISDHYFVPEQVVFDDDGNVLDDGSDAGDTDIATQTRDTFTKLRAILEQAGCKLEDVIDLVVWLRDPRDFVGFNNVYKEFFATEPPARAVLRNAFMFTTRIEVKAIAYKPL
jgi:enamine deaminase RidA (YjgF/YER057c/UK114 family)